MILGLIALLINAGWTTLPFALEPMLNEKNWHVFLPWYGLLFAAGMFVGPVAFLFVLPFITLKTGIIVGTAMIGCMVVLAYKLICTLQAITEGAQTYRGEVTIAVKKTFLGGEEYLLSIPTEPPTKLSVSPILASRFIQSGIVKKSLHITCTYLPYLQRIFRITVHDE